MLSINKIGDVDRWVDSMSTLLEVLILHPSPNDRARLEAFTIGRAGTPLSPRPPNLF